MAHGISVPSRGRAAPRAPKRLLAVRADEHLVERVRRGDEAAFEVIYERHVPGLLSFCRHMLGSREEAEDAVQHSFTSAHRALLRDERDIRLKPWLYSIARNRCLSMLRARREQPDDDFERTVDGLDAEVQRRADLRELVDDLHDLPEDQRAALVLHELRALSHAEVAEVLDCKVANVKGLVFRARAGLTERRDARDTPCQEVREELATARGGALRRGRLRHHLRACEGCSGYLEEVRSQRKAMAAILPVVPTLGLKSSVLAAVGVGGGGAAGGGAAGGGLLAALLPAGGTTAAKVAIVGAVVVGGGGLAGQAALDGGETTPSRAPFDTPSAPAAVPGGGADPANTAEPQGQRGAKGQPAGTGGPAAKLKKERVNLNRKRVQARRKLARRPAARGRAGAPGQAVRQRVQSQPPGSRGLLRRPTTQPPPVVPPRPTREPRTLSEPRRRADREPPAPPVKPVD